MTTLMGHNEAETRLKATLRQVNTGGIEYPSATNNRGQGGREKHADGDMVGGGNNNDDDDSERHAAGGRCGGSMPSQGGARRPSNFHPSSEMPSQGGTHMKPMGGYLKAPRSKAGRESHAVGDMVGREKHGFGNMVGRAFRGAKSAAQPYVNQGVNYAKQQGQNIGNAAMQYGQQQGQHLMNQGKNYVAGQLNAGANALTQNPPMQPQPYKRGGRAEMREDHSFGKSVGKAFKSAGKAAASGVKTAAKAAAPYAKQAASSMLKEGAKSAMTGAMAAKRGGNIERRNGHR